MTTAPTDFSAAEAAQLLGSAALSAVELAEFYLRRIEDLNSSCNAVLAIAPDVLTAAREADGRRRSGLLRGSLDGVPVLIKDNIEAAGLPGTAGSRALANSPVSVDAPLVARLRAAGLIVLGSTNLSEWANFRSTNSTSGWSAMGGQVRNPQDLQRNPSGSSSGSAAAIAAGLAPLAVGTETDGSIVSPAGMCGLVGFKPTVGTVPGAGIVPISPVQDTAGPMTRTVADAALLYRALAGLSVSAEARSLAGVRVAVWTPGGTTNALAAVLAEVSERLRVAGAVAVPVSLPAAEEPAGPFANAEFDALVGEFAVALPAYLAARPGPHPRTWPELLSFNRADDVELSQFSDEIFALAAAADPAHATAARAACTAESERDLAAVLGDCAFAVTITNGPAGVISYGRSEHEAVSISSLCAVTGAPSITLPGFRVGGLPVGISLLGSRDSDLELLSWAAAVEAVLPEVTWPEP